MFDKLAEELKEARIRNNLTLKQLSTKTRIDIKFLEAMEEGNLSFLPDLYVKAFIKEYASVVGLNVEVTLKKYEAAKEGLPYEEINETQQEEEINDVTEKTTEEKSTEEKPVEAKPEEKTEKQKELKHSATRSDAVYSQPVTMFDATSPKRSDLKTGNKSSYFIGAVIGGIIIVFGLIYLLFFKNSSEIIVPEKPYDEVVSESQQRYEQKPGTAADTSQSGPVSSDSLNLLIQTTDTSWVKIIFDNSTEEEFILFPNSQKAIKAKDNFTITFGKSSAIKLKLNNKPLPFNPRSTVSYVVINSKGLEFLYKPPVKGMNDGNDSKETN